MTRNLSPQFGSSEYHQQVLSGAHPPAMFATAPEIVGTHYLNDISGFQSTKSPEDKKRFGSVKPFKNKEELMEYKEQENPELSKDIQKKGFDWSEPITTSRLVYSTQHAIVDGHHRLAAMLRHRPTDFIPMKPYAPQGLKGAIRGD